MSTDNVEIEVYVRTDDVDSIVALLSASVGDLEPVLSSEPDVHIYKGSETSIVIQPSEDGFLSVWVRGHSPWSSSPALARHLAQGLLCTTRCDPGQEFPEVSPHSDTFLEIEGGRESLVSWG